MADPANSANPADPADRLYFHQLLSGRDFAVDDPLASQMVNFVYLIGDRQTGEAVVVDPAYAVNDLLDRLATDGMRLTGVLATHHHPDHVGGSMMSYSIQGVSEVLKTQPVQVNVNRNEAEWVRRTAGISATDLVAHDSGPSSWRAAAALTFPAPTPRPCTKACNTSPLCPTTPRSSPATGTRRSRRARWRRSNRSTTSTSPATKRRG